MVSCKIIPFIFPVWWESVLPIYTKFSLLVLIRPCYCPHGRLTRSVYLRVAHAPGISGTFSPPPLVSDPVMHHGTCVTHEPWCMPESQTSGFLWGRWRGKRSRHSQRMRHTQFYVSGKRPMPVNHSQIIWVNNFHKFRNCLQNQNHTGLT